METAVNHIKLRVERSSATAVLRALLTAIFFHRRLDNVEPETVDILETHVAAAVDREIDREVAAKVDEFAQTFVEAGCDSGEIAVVFLQRKNRKGWFAVTEALVPWEEHLITITFVTRATTNPLPGALLQLLTFCLENKSNVPPLVGTSDQNNLSHQIMISPPPPSDLFAPSSPPSDPARLTSPPPRPATTPAAIPNAPRLQPSFTTRSSSRSASPMTAITDAGTSAITYFEQAKDGLLAVGAKAAGTGAWGGRAVFGSGRG